MSYGGRTGLGRRDQDGTRPNGRVHCPIGVGRCVAPLAKVTGGVSLGDLGVDAIAPRYVREADATAQAYARKRGLRRRLDSANLGGYPRERRLGFDAGGDGTGVGGYPDGGQLGALGIAPAVALFAGKVLGGLFSGPKGPSIQALVTQALGGPTTVGGGAVGAATELAEFASNPSLPDAAQYQQAWSIVVAQAPDVAAQAYQRARTKPALPPAGIRPTVLPAFSAAAAPVAAGSGGAASLLSMVAQGFFETPAGGQVLTAATQGAVQAKVEQAKSALAGVPVMVWLTGAGLLLFLAGRQRR